MPQIIANLFRESPMRIALSAMAVLLLATSTMLVKVSMANRSLQRDETSAGLPEVPERIPTLRLPTIAGDSFEIASGRQQTILVIKTDCGFCNETLPIWKELFPSIPGSGSTVVLSLDSPELTKGYLSANSLPFPIASVGESVRQLLGLGPVPQTLMLDEHGSVTYSRVGTLAGVPTPVLDSIRNRR